MMDLREALAADFAKAIFEDLLSHGILWGLEPGRQEILLAHWKDLIMERFQDRSLLKWEDPGAVELFINKYPGLREYVDQVIQLTRDIWPKAEILPTIGNDYESCHICQEGQHLVLGIYYGNEGSDEDYDAFWDAFVKIKHPLEELVVVNPLPHR